jgi:hypothetical protein
LAAAKSANGGGRVLKKHCCSIDLARKVSTTTRTDE